jgi:hypothetical protein
MDASYIKCDISPTAKAIRRRIIKLHTNTADICINSNNQNSTIMSIQITYNGSL